MKDKFEIESEIEAEGLKIEWFKNPQKWRQELKNHNRHRENFEEREYARFNIHRIIFSLLLQQWTEEEHARTITLWDRYISIYERNGRKKPAKKLLLQHLESYDDLGLLYFECDLLNLSVIDILKIKAGIENGTTGIRSHIHDIEHQVSE